jgi:hypothetical protein
MKKAIVVALALMIATCGCGTIAEKLADALEPRIEKIVDTQIEREERAAGIWGTTNSYFYVETVAEEASIREEAEALVASKMDDLLKEVDALITERLKGGK